MAHTMQRRRFLNRLVTTNTKPIAPAIENNLSQPKISSGTLKANSAQSGIGVYNGAWTEKEMIHLLRRITFGAPKTSVDLIKGKTMSQAVDFLIDNPVQPAVNPLNVYTPGADSGGVPFGKSWIDVKLPDPVDTENKRILYNNRLHNSFKPWALGQMINQKTHILEKMTLFWSNHFGVESSNNNHPKAIFQYYKILRTYGMTDFRGLIKQITVDPQMLYFLSGNSNSKASPNENFARELQELFTVGKGPDAHYTEDDVQNAARVLTGWQIAQSSTDGSYSSNFNPSRHDVTDKQFSAFYNNKVIAGQSGMDGASEVDALINMILQTNECAKYIVRRLYIWFVYYNITPDIEANVITPLATIFRNSNYSIPTLLKALFKSEHFFDPLNYGVIIKSPVDLYVSMIRECNVTLAASPVDIMYAHWKNIYQKCMNEGQNIGDPPNVAGWAAYYQTPDYYEAWMSSASIQAKAKNLKAFSNAGITVGDVNIVIDSVAFNKQFPDAGNADAVVKNFIQYLLPVDNLSDEQKSVMKAILVPVNEADTYWSNEWNKYKADPATYYKEVKVVLDNLMRPILAMAEYYLY